MGWRLSGEKVHLERVHEQRRLRYLDRYFREVLGVDARTRRQILREVRDALQQGRLDPSDPEAFARGVLQLLRRRYPAVAGPEMERVVQTHLERIYRVYRLSDTSPLRGEGVLRGFQAQDQQALEFLKRFEHFTLSRYVDNRDFRVRIQEEMIRAIQEGLDADTVVDRLGEVWRRIGRQQLRRVVDTGLTRARTFAQVRQMAEAGVAALEVVEVMDRITCPYCREMDGKVVDVARVEAFVQEALSLDPEEFSRRFLHPPDLETLRATPMAQLVAQGRGLPPIHPHCRGRVRMHLHKTRRQVEQERHWIPKRYPSDPALNYADYGRRVIVVDWGRGEREPRRRTLLWSVRDPLGNTVYFTREAERHLSRREEEVRSSVHQVLRAPDAIYVDSRYGEDIHAYVRKWGGRFLYVVVKKGNAKIVATAFFRRKLPQGLDLIWGEELR